MAEVVNGGSLRCVDVYRGGELGLCRFRALRRRKRLKSPKDREVYLVCKIVCSARDMAVNVAPFVLP